MFFVIDTTKYNFENSKVVQFLKVILWFRSSVTKVVSFRVENGCKYIDRLLHRALFALLSN